MPTQLPLDIPLSRQMSFDTFHAGGNAEGIEQLRRAFVSDESTAFHLWGPAGTGKSHILQALCHDLGGRGDAVAYLPMDVVVVKLEPAAMGGLEGLRAICVDHLEAVNGDAMWDSALAGLLDRARDSGSSVVFSGRHSPDDPRFVAPALSFRLSMTWRLELQPLAPEDLIWALQAKARARGSKLPAEVGRYLVRHYGRDVRTLMNLIDTLDYAALASKRSLTKPFIRSVLARPPDA